MDLFPLLYAKLLYEFLHDLQAQSLERLYIVSNLCLHLQYNSMTENRFQHEVPICFAVLVQRVPL